MQSQYNEFCVQATERLFLAVVNQAISDVLENGKRPKKQSDGCSARISIPCTDYSRLLPTPVEPQLQERNQRSS
jgi:hypothetical protein